MPTESKYELRSAETFNNNYPLSPPPTSRYAWAVVGMLWFICFFNYADRVAIASVFPVLAQQYHFTKSQLGLIGSAFTWVYAAFAPIAGDTGDKYPRKWVILAGLYIWSAITGVTGACSRVWQFVAVRGAEGLGETFYFPASMALIADYHPPRTRSRAIGFHQTSIYAGTVFGGTAAGYLAQRHGWQSPFICFAIAGIALGLILNRFIIEPKRNQAELNTAILQNGSNDIAEIPIWQFVSEFLKTKTAVLLVAAYFGANLVGFVFLTWMPTFLKDKFHVTLVMAGFAGTFFIQASSMLGAALGGVIADHRSIKIVTGRIQVQGAAILLGAPFIFICGYTRNTVALMIAMSLFGLCKGVYDANLTASFYDVISPARRGTATGIMNLIGWIGAGLGVWLVGVAVDHGITMSIAISSLAIIYILSAGTLWYSSAFTAQRDIRLAS